LHEKSEKLNNILKSEQQKNESQRKSFETSQQAIETLTERVASLEREKSQLSVQSEKFSKVTQEAMSFKKNAADLRTELAAKERELEKEKVEKATIEHSHSELLRKIKDLQKENDELVVKLEGLKTENDGLISKNKRLEEQIRTVEGNNKIHLKQINETLKVPSEQSRVSRGSEFTTTPPISDISFESPSTRIPPHLSINDESRSTPEKNSTIAPLSPSVKSTTEVAFMDTFSRSVSKDDEDDHFDTKTYSIDQVSDTEGLSELIEDDDEVDTVSFAK
jgi:predicted nuclease with TOPRIM domain